MRLTSVGHVELRPAPVRCDVPSCAVRRTGVCAIAGDQLDVAWRRVADEVVEQGHDGLGEVVGDTNDLGARTIQSPAAM